MDYASVLARLTTQAGVTGREQNVAAAIAQEFRAYTDDVWIDRSGSVFARIGQGRPVVFVAAHMDEIGMMVTDILDNGFLRFRSVAGVDPRVLPGSQVVVDGEKTLTGIVGAVPPHLLKERDNAYKMTELSIDLGLDVQTVRSLVHIGDMVRFDPVEPLALKNDRLAGKTLDNRAHVAVMLHTMELLARRKLDCTAVFCATVQEEFSGLGAITGTYNIEPDIAIAIDVTHGRIPSAAPYESFDMDKVVLTRGSNIHPKLLGLLEEAAGELNIALDYEVCIGATGTDAWDMQVARGATATALISTPLKYMHTSVETIALPTLANCARLLTQTIASLGADWEERLCLDD